MREDGRKTGRHDKADSRFLQFLLTRLKTRESNSNLEEFPETTDLTPCDKQEQKKLKLLNRAVLENGDKEQFGNN